MQFKVPQFIDIEDKIFGPFTFKEFIYLVGGGGLCYLFFQVLPFILAVIVAIPVGGLALALAFYKVNGKPFIFVLENSFKYLLQKKIYIWKKEANKKEIEGEETKKEEVSFNPKLSKSKLKDIAWSLDILESPKNDLVEKDK